MNALYKEKKKEKQRNIQTSNVGNSTCPLIERKEKTVFFKIIIAWELHWRKINIAHYANPVVLPSMLS